MTHAGRKETAVGCDDLVELVQLLGAGVDGVRVLQAAGEAERALVQCFLEEGAHLLHLIVRRRPLGVLHRGQAEVAQRYKSSDVDARTCLSKFLEVLTGRLPIEWNRSVVAEYRRGILGTVP